MFASPSQNGQTEPGKTPSKWAAALGIFSTAKKPPRPSSVEPGTNDTTGECHNANHNLSAVAEASFHGSSTANGDAGLDASMENETFMSPLSPHLSTAGKSVLSTGNNNNTNAMMMTSPAGTGNSGRHKASRLEFSSLGSSRMTTASTPLAEGATNQLASLSTMAVGGTAKSPWHNNNKNNNTANTRGVSFQLGTNTPVGAQSPWQGKRSRSRRNDTPGAKAPPHQQHNMMSRPITFRTVGGASQRTRRYRPNAVGLVGSETLGRSFHGKKFDPAGLSTALLTLKENSFLPKVNSDPSNVYAGPGKVKYGPLSHPSRTPRMQQKRQRNVERMQPPSAEDLEGESRNSKRRKKVCFNQEENEEEDQAVVSKITATPFRSTAMRKGTPMPRKLMESSPAAVTTAADSMSYEPDDDNDDEGGNTGAASVAFSQSNEQLPDPPAPFVFKSGATLTFDDIMPQSMGPVVLDPHKQALLFKQSNFLNLLARPAPLPDPSEKFAASYYRPPSPVHKLKDDDDGDDDDNGGGGQKTKRMKKDEKVPDWKCSKCGKMNDNEESTCTDENCKAGRSTKIIAGGWGGLMNKFIPKEGEWKCETCLVMNPMDATECSSCEAPKGAKGVAPGEKKKKATSPAPAAEMKTSFPFATNNTAKPGGFSFGSNPTPGLSVPAKTAETAKFSFSATPATKTAASATPGTGATVGGFTFGGVTTPAAAAPAPTTGGFTFGSTPVPPQTTAESTAPAFGAPPAAATGPPSCAFGASTAKTNGDSTAPEKPSNPAPSPAPAPTFASDKKKDEATPAPTPATATPAVQFGAGASAPSTGTSFGAPASTPAPNGNFGFSFSASTPAPSAPAESKSTQKVKRSRGYDLNGGDSKAPAPASAAKPAPAPTLFGVTAPTAPSTEAPFKFGSTPAAADSGAPKPFGSTPAVPFGGTPAVPAPAPTTGIQFEAATPVPTAPAPAGGAGIFTFGASQTPAPAPSAPNGFGAPPAAAGPAPAAFGAAPSAPAFGSSPAPAVPAFGSTPAPAPAAPAFGSTPAAPTPAATTFGSTPAAPTPAFGFGGTGQAPAFGAPTPSAPGFGGASNPQSSTSFGAAPSFGAQTSGAPPGVGFNASFGTNQAPNTGGFGSNPAAPSTGGFGGNGFGAPQTGGFQSTPAAPGGFGGGGFGGAAPNTAPPGGGGGFSIGSSGAPKTKRRLVRAKRPTRPA